MTERIRVVVADDQQVMREGLVALLELINGIEITGAAANGAEAVDLVAEGNVDVVLMDLRMPVLDGFQATARIKRDWPRVRVLVLSIAAEARDQALAAGADAFVAKGAPEDLLLDTIRTLACAP